MKRPASLDPSLIGRGVRRAAWSGAKTGAARERAERLEPVEKVVAQSVAWGLKSCAQEGSSRPRRCARGRKSAERAVQEMRVPPWLIVTVQSSERRRALLVWMWPSYSHSQASSDALESSAGGMVRSVIAIQRSAWLARVRVERTVKVRLLCPGEVFGPAFAPEAADVSVHEVTRGG